MEIIWGLCLLCLVMAPGTIHAAPLKKTEKMEDVAAPEEEVRLLMFGVVQLSESLNNVYETTGAKIDKIIQTLKSKEEALKKLGRQTEQAVEVERQMKEVIQLLQAQMALQQAETKRNKDWLANLEQEELELKTKVEKLEKHLNNHSPTSIKELKERAEELTSVLKGLQLLTEFQKESIETQNEKLSELLQKSETDG